MNTAELAVRRPRVVVLAALLLLVYGALSWQGLPRQENPTLRERFASVLTYLPGADPEKVELLVTKVLEDEIAEVDDIRHVFSRSGPGTSFLLVEVDESAPAAERLQQIRDRVQEARLRFPAGASEPEVDTRVFRTNTLVIAVVGEGASPLALRDHAKDLRRALEQLPDVRRVEVRGLPEEEIEVAVDLRRLAQRGIPLARVTEALAARNVRLPSGELETGAVRSSIHTSGAFDAVGELGGAGLGAGAEGLPIRLADVARVDRRLAEPEVEVRYRGAGAVALGVEMLPHRNAVALGERVRALLAERAAGAPPGVRTVVVADEPTYVDDRLSLLTGSLLVGLGLVVGLALVGLGWRSGVVVSVTIPLSLTVAVGLQALLEVPLHQISIAALVIAIGIVVDESIVVTDNIQRHLDAGEPPETAAVRGLGEIHLAVIAGAATTLAAFIPLWAMGGDIGTFIRSIPVVVSVMLLGSLAVAHFVTPLLAVALHRTGGPRSRGLWERVRLEAAYRPLVARIVRRPRAVLAGFVALVAGTGALVAGALWPPSFFPDADRHQFLVRVELPVGAPLAETGAVIGRIEERLRGDPDVRDWTAFVGADAPKFYYNEFDDGRAESRGMLIVNTRGHVPFDRTAEVVERIAADLTANVPGARIRARPLRQGYAGGDDIEIYVTGDDLEVLRILSGRVREVVEAVPGIARVRESFGYDPVTLEARVHAARANALGITHRQVATTLRTAVDGVRATSFREDDEEIAIRVRLVEGQRRHAGALATLPLFSPRTGETVPLSQVAELAPGFTTRAILRYDRRREAKVEADLVPGASLLEVAGRVEDAVRGAVPLPPGYDALFYGQQEEVTESFLSLAKAAVVAVFLIYIVLVVRFQSLAQPLLILLAVPMSLVGASWGLAATGNPLGFMAFLGMISLTGIAVNDSIVLVDTANRLRDEGLAPEAAVVRGATRRLRAVLMTSLTTIGGLLPLSLTGGAFWAPFGFAMIFGLAGATLLTLGVLPAAWLALERRRSARAPREGRSTAPHAGA